MSEDLFLKIIAREIPADIVYETEEVLAFRDISPQAPTHILVIPKRHITDINHLEESDERLMGKLIQTGKELAAKEGLSERGYRLVFNVGEDAGYTVFHIHLHLLGGRKMTWPPG